MINLAKWETYGWEAAIRGARNPMNSWKKSDTTFEYMYNKSVSGDPLKVIGIGPNDHRLLLGLAQAGPDHGKFMRMITVYVDITAPLYWWKEFDTYKVGTVANSCSTMHKIHSKEFTLDDFSYEHLTDKSINMLKVTIQALNYYREAYLETKDKEMWWQMIQLLPSSYNQKRTVMVNYEVLRNIYNARKNHKLDEWRYFCEWITTLPYKEFIIGEKEEIC